MQKLRLFVCLPVQFFHPSSCFHDFQDFCDDGEMGSILRDGFVLFCFVCFLSVCFLRVSSSFQVFQPMGSDSFSSKSGDLLPIFGCLLGTFMFFRTAKLCQSLRVIGLLFLPGKPITREKGVRAGTYDHKLSEVRVCFLWWLGFAGLTMSGPMGQTIFSIG